MKPLTPTLFASFIIALGGCQPAARVAVETTPTATPETEVVDSASRVQPETEAVSWHFTDITKEAGLNFRHVNGANGLSFLPEAMGSGVAVFDWDNDGCPDLYFANARPWTKAELMAYKFGRWNNAERAWFHKKYPKSKFSRNVPKAIANAQPTGALYRNDGKGHFQDVTKLANLNFTFYGMGAYPADYDGDGRTDLFLTGLDRCYLLHNENGHFRDVTQEMGLNIKGWATCALWLDSDKDGDLDLFVGRYVKWTPATDIFAADGKNKVCADPHLYEGETALFFRNDGSKFVEATAQVGIKNRVLPKHTLEPITGRMLGAALCDFNNDGWPDIAVANDGGRNLLFRNDKGVFVEQGEEAGMTGSKDDTPRASRGIDTGDYNNSNQDSILVANSPLQMFGLFQNLGNKLFSDVAPVNGVGEGSRDFFGFGIEFLDLDNDGWQDIFVANGHIYPQSRIRPQTIQRLQRPLIFRNLDGISFEEIGSQCGPALNKGYLGRGLARVDFDRDGDLDVVMTTNNGAPLFLRNDDGHHNNSVRLELRGRGHNRDGLGTLLKIRANGQTLRRWVRSGSSYLSQSEAAITIGIGDAAQVDDVSIYWPASQAKKPVRIGSIPANTRVIVDEIQGIISQQQLQRPKSTRLEKPSAPRASH